MSQDLPSDILLLIFKHLDSPSKKQLCLVSQYFHSIFAPILLRNVRVLFCQENGTTSESIDERLQTSQSTLSNLYKHARSLRVRTQGYYLTRHVTSSLLPAVWETIKRMTLVESLELEWSRYDSDEKMETIMEYQEHVVRSVLEAKGNQLNQLILKPDSGSRTLPAFLDRIRGLTSLRIIDEWTCPSFFVSFDDDQEDHCNCYCPWMRGVIKPLIAANPGLEILEIKQGCKNQGPHPNDILPETLTNLTSLTISGFTMCEAVRVSPLRNLRHLVVRVPSGQLKTDAFWDALRAAKPPLETLVSFQVSDSMLKYLASFSGLRSLEMNRIGHIMDSNISELASIFLNSVLPRHAESLERLVVEYSANHRSLPGWDFDPITWSPVLSRLSRLRYLAIFPRLSVDDTDSLESSTSASQLTKAYQTILDNIIDIPRLHTLKLDFPQPSFGCGTGYMRWRSGVDKTLGEVVPELRVMGGKPEVLELYHGKQSCVRLDGEVWGYRPQVVKSKSRGGLQYYM